MKKAKDYFSKANLKGKALFLSQANTINPIDTSPNLHFESIVQFNSIMESFNRSDLRYQYKYYGGDDHGSAPLISEYDGLRFIFDGYKVNYSQLAENPSLIKEQFRSLSARLGAEFLPPEDVINNLGYQSMQRGDSAKAIEIFQLNIDLYPRSYNVWDSMAEALMYAGDYKKAMAYYEKSLSLNPKNENGRQMIKKMKEKKN
jgi:tetratricopeptide (TPR) repeat protein